MNQYFKLPEKIVDREETIIDLCTDKRVLHLGCIDFPLLDFRLKSGTWLHGKLMKVTRELVGIDNARNDIEFLKKKYEINNVICIDVEEISKYESKPFEVIVAGEIIEHLSNPGLFLEGIKHLISKNGIFIFTTINAYCLRRFIRIPFGIESVHPDHKFYFSHSTLTSLIERNGFKIKKRFNYRLPKSSSRVSYIFELLISVISNNLVEGFLYVAEI